MLRVTIYDVEKDGWFDKFWRNALTIAFGVGMEIFSGGLAITVGNVLTALKKKPEDRPEIEKQFDDLISASRAAGKMNFLGEGETGWNKWKMETVSR
jgi:hypothetical protein